MKIQAIINMLSMLTEPLFKNRSNKAWIELVFFS